MSLPVAMWLIFAVGVASVAGSMCAAFYASRHRDDLDPATEARIWASAQAALKAGEER